ncbi:3-methyl-2-oxobutanoate dehydrogenase subunit VorB [Candidatus Chlorohelix sp.]|uniref:3-methyl-2-oxobutanoate dehydrogenase subunit VorB n=1 Tax=Candidatus Chlorohelix sp. TaxID=3139201 RepID=UPI00301F7AEA
MVKELWKGNEAIAEAAVRAGMEAYFGYPITPQTELLEYLSRRMPELGRVFIQAESELAAINMVYGAAVAGAYTMTSSSSPGMSLMQEGLSYIAASNVPCVIVDMMRGGPGLGNLGAAQADYFQLTKGGGHGDYRPIVYAPNSVQEAVDITYKAFEIAEKYRTIVIIAGDGNIGQIMEPAEMPPMKTLDKVDRGWELTGSKGRTRRFNTSLYLQVEELEAQNLRLREKEALIRQNEGRYEERWTEQAELLVVAFGSVARGAWSAVKEARERGIMAGFFRPISLSPFPYLRLEELSQHVKEILVVECNAGQMVEDVRLAVGSQAMVKFYGRLGGIVPLPDEILTEIITYETTSAYRVTAQPEMPELALMA